jgi:hypothetical protein
MGMNAQRICHPEFDRLHEASIFEIDPNKRRDLLIEQGNIVNDAATRGIVYFKKNIVATRPHLRNFFANVHSVVACFPWLWLDEEA